MARLTAIMQAEIPVEQQARMSQLEKQMLVGIEIAAC